MTSLSTEIKTLPRRLTAAFQTTARKVLGDNTFNSPRVQNHFKELENASHGFAREVINIARSNSLLREKLHAALTETKDTELNAAELEMLNSGVLPESFKENGEFKPSKLAALADLNNPRSEKMVLNPFQVLDAFADNLNLRSRKELKVDDKKLYEFITKTLVAGQALESAGDVNGLLPAGDAHENLEKLLFTTLDACITALVMGYKWEDSMLDQSGRETNELYGRLKTILKDGKNMNKVLEAIISKSFYH